MVWSGQVQGDVYDRLTYRLNYPDSKNLRRIFELACSPEEAEVVDLLPDQARPTSRQVPPVVTAEEIAGKLGRDKEIVENQLEDLFQRGVITLRHGTAGQSYYVFHSVIETIHDEMLRVIGAHLLNETTREIDGDVEREIADSWQKFCVEEWYRWERVDEQVHNRVAMIGPGYRFTVQPAWKALEKSDCQIPDPTIWDARQAARAAKRIVVTPCPCHVRARACDRPIWSCTALLQTQHIPIYDRRGIARDLTPEQWLELMGECEERGMIHTGILPFGPFACACETCCCNVIVPLIEHATIGEGLNRSPFRSVVDKAACEGCPDCVPMCQFGAVKIAKDEASGKRKATVDIEKCWGCGLCVVGCKVKGAMKLELADKLTAPA